MLVKVSDFSLAVVNSRLDRAQNGFTMSYRLSKVRR